MIPVTALSPEGRDVEVEDPGFTAAELAEPARDYSRYAEFCRLTAQAESIEASAHRLHAVAAALQPEVLTRGDAKRYHDRIAESCAMRAAAYQRMAEDEERKGA